MEEMKEPADVISSNLSVTQVPLSLSSLAVLPAVTEPTDSPIPQQSREEESSVIRSEETSSGAKTVDGEAGRSPKSQEAVQQQRQIQIWNGDLEWYGWQDKLTDTERQEGEIAAEILRNQARTLPCTIYGNIVNGIPEITSIDSETGNKWGRKFIMHLMPKADFRRLDVQYIRNTKQVNLSFGNSPYRPQLNRLMRTGRYAGCVHIPSTFEAKSPQLKTDMNVILLLYSKGKQAVMGFVPNDQTAFVNQLLNVIPDHLSQVDSEKEDSDSMLVDEIKSSLSDGWKPIENSSKSSSTDVSKDQIPEDSPLEDNDVALVNMEVDAENVASFWDYNLSAGFKTARPLGQTSDKEFVSPTNHRKKATFLKGCKWAPDGSCLISNSDDDILRLFNVPESIYQIKDWQADEDITYCGLDSVLKVKEGGQVYDYCWYPMMSSYDPVSSCFLTTTADSPVHLWDAFSGKLRASYLAYNNVDEVTAARCVAFDPSGEYIYCGFDTMLRTFNITRPGRQCTERKLKHSQITELSQPGIISCIAVNPSLRSVQALGSYLKTVGLYYDDGSVLCILQGHVGGVTHLKFSQDGTKLFSGGRKDSSLICWDMRYMGEQYKIYDRVVETNQRVYFDLTPNDKYLITGGTDGFVKFWDLTNESADPLSFDANSDCVNGVSINPFLPILATSSGQRHLQPILNDSSDEDEDDDMPKRVPERGIKLWKFC